MHSWGGGVERWVARLLDADREHENFVLKSVGTAVLFGRRSTCIAISTMQQPLRRHGRWNPASRRLPVRTPAYRDILSRIVQEHGIRAHYRLFPDRTFSRLLRAARLPPSSSATITIRSARRYTSRSTRCAVPAIRAAPDRLHPGQSVTTASSRNVPARRMAACAKRVRSRGERARRHFDRSLAFRPRQLRPARARARSIVPRHSSRSPRPRLAFSPSRVRSRQRLYASWSSASSLPIKAVFCSSASLLSSFVFATCFWSAAENSVSHTPKIQRSL